MSNVFFDVMKVCRDCTIEKPAQDFYLGSNGKPFASCKECVSLQRKRFYRKHREELGRRTREYTDKNPGIAMTAMRRWMCKNKRKTPGEFRVPHWADLGAIDALYKTARAMTKASGVQHVVDHIVPIGHELVSGLHCEFNLRVVTASENSRKGNRHWPDMPTFLFLHAGSDNQRKPAASISLGGYR